MFDKNGFMDYIKEEFSGVIDNHWNYDLLENIIHYGIDNLSDQIVDFLVKIIPEITEEEILKFIE